MKNYVCLSINIPENQQDELIALFSNHEPEGFEQNNNELKVYFPESHFNQSEFLPFIQRYSYEIITLCPQNWNETWEKNFPMVTIEGICEIYASHHQPTFSQPYAIFIQPQMSFGTGHHATTQLMIKLIHAWDAQHKQILDMGAGTGILGIFALLKKAHSVTFMDIEPIGIENIKENILRNQLPSQPVFCGDHIAISGEFDAIFANIQKNVLELHASTYYQHLKKNGDLFLSGFFEKDEKNLLNLYLNLGFEFTNRLEENGWIALQLKKL